VTLDLKPSKCGQFMNIKNVVKPYHPVQVLVGGFNEKEEIPF
jgi:hypothetical protein